MSRALSVLCLLLFAARQAEGNGEDRAKKLVAFAENAYGKILSSMEKWYPWMSGDFKPARYMASEAINSARHMCYPFCFSKHFLTDMCNLNQEDDMVDPRKTLPVLYGPKIGDKGGDTLCDFVLGDEDDFFSGCMKICQTNMFQIFDMTLVQANKKIKQGGGESSSESSSESSGGAPSDSGASSDGWNVGRLYETDEINDALVALAKDAYPSNESQSLPAWAAFAFAGSAIITLSMGVIILRLRKRLNQVAGDSAGLIIHANEESVE